MSDGSGFGSQALLQGMRRSRDLLAQSTGDRAPWRFDRVLCLMGAGSGFAGQRSHSGFAGQRSLRPDGYGFAGQRSHSRPAEEELVTV